MKLAISTLACKNWTLAYTLDICNTYGIDALELRTGLNDWSDVNMPPAAQQEVHAMCQASGVSVCDIGTGILLNHDDPAATEELHASITLAHTLGATGLRIMLGHFWDRHSEHAHTPPCDLAGMRAWLLRADRLLAQEGLELWLETHNEYATGQSLRELLSSLQTDHIKLLWDFMHPLEVGERAEDTLRYMGRDLVHVHIKDGRPFEDPDFSRWRYTALGKGDIPIADMVRLLLANGYDGYFSLEWESLWRSELEGIPNESAVADFSALMRTIAAQ